MELEVDVKILAVAYMNPTTIDYPVYLSNQWRELGHVVENFSVDLEVISEPWFQFLNAAHPSYNAVLELRVDKACEHFTPDVLLLMYNFLTAKGVIRLKRKHGCIVGSCIDHNYLLSGEAAQVLSLSDFAIVHDSYLTPIIQGSGLGQVKNVFYLPGLVEPTEHVPMALSQEDRARYGANIAFIGCKGPDRLTALPRIANRGLRIWGISEEWKAYPELYSLVVEEPIYGIRKTKIYNAASIVFSLEEKTKQINSLNPRITEVLACGGFVLCNWTKDLEEAGFQDGHNVAWFKTPDEMEAKVDYYLSDPQKRHAVSRRGREHVLQKLTYQTVAPKIAEAMEQVLVAKRSNDKYSTLDGR